MRATVAVIPLLVSFAVFSSAPAAQGVNWEGLMRQGMNEVIRSINTPAAPSYPASSSPSSPSQGAVSQKKPAQKASQVASAAERNVDARITDNMLGSPAEFRAFFNQLKQAVSASDKHALAKMMNYPLNVSAEGPSVRTSSDFITHYDRIFTPHVISVVDKQTYGDLFVRDQGAAMGNGDVWFTGACVDQACKRRTPKVISVFAK